MRRLSLAMMCGAALLGSMTRTQAQTQPHPHQHQHPHPQAQCAPQTQQTQQPQQGQQAQQHMHHHHLAQQAHQAQMQHQHLLAEQQRLQWLHQQELLNQQQQAYQQAQIQQHLNKLHAEQMQQQWLQQQEAAIKQAMQGGSQSASATSSAPRLLGPSSQSVRTDPAACQSQASGSQSRYTASSPSTYQPAQPAQQPYTTAVAGKDPSSDCSCQRQQSLLKRSPSSSSQSAYASTPTQGSTQQNLHHVQHTTSITQYSSTSSFAAQPDPSFTSASTGSNCVNPRAVRNPIATQTGSTQTCIQQNPGQTASTQTCVQQNPVRNASTPAYLQQNPVPTASSQAYVQQNPVPTASSYVQQNPVQNASTSSYVQQNPVQNASTSSYIQPNPVTPDPSSPQYVTTSGYQTPVGQPTALQTPACQPQQRLLRRVSTTTNQSQTTAQFSQTSTQSTQQSSVANVPAANPVAGNGQPCQTNGSNTTAVATSAQPNNASTVATTTASNAQPCQPCQTKSSSTSTTTGTGTN